MKIKSPKGFTVNRRIWKRQHGKLILEDTKLVIVANSGADASRIADEAKYSREQPLRQAGLID